MQSTEVKLLNPKLRNAFKHFEVSKAEFLKDGLSSHKQNSNVFKENI